MLRIIIVIITLICLGISAQAEPTFKIIHLDVKYGYGSSTYTEKNPASFFEAKSKRAIIFAHQSGEKKESWHPLAEHFQKLNIASISLEQVTGFDIESAITFLKNKGYSKIVLVGASIGGGGVLSALRGDYDASITHVVLLAPSFGPALKHTKINKLFVVAKQDFFSRYTYSGYKEASQPKLLKEYPGREHAQSLLKGKYKDDLIKVIEDFLGIKKDS